jgi:adenosylcobinamide kinase / adenosylcobinamide-phosphate guanylyltransferase
VDVLVVGTGGARGWPEPGCHCASCMRARTAGLRRAPGRVLVDDWLEVVPGEPLRPGTGPAAATTLQINRVPSGFEITGPDSSRLLLAGGPGEVPQPPPGARPYDLALLDLLGSPRQLGLLRASGLVHSRTAVVALYTDHRVSSPDEMARRCALWAAGQAHDGQLVSSIPADRPAPPRAGPHRTLIVGGARSGKSSEAELRLAAEPAVMYVAAGPFAPAREPGHSGARADINDAGPQSWTGPDGEPDTEWARRIAIHRARRPDWWRTVESLDLAEILHAAEGAVLIDGIGTWLAAVLDETGMWTAAGSPAGDGIAGRARAEGALRARIDELIEAWRQTGALVVAVTDEVGSGLVPAYPAGRIFRDQLGWLNQRLAAESELNLQVVAGRVTTLPG